MEDCEFKISSFELVASHLIRRKRTLSKEEEYCIVLNECLTSSLNEKNNLQREVDNLQQIIESCKQRQALLLSTRSRLQESFSMERKKEISDEKEKAFRNQQKEALSRKILAMKERYNYSLELLKNKYPEKFDNDIKNTLSRVRSLRHHRNELQQEIASLKMNSLGSTGNKEWNLWKEHVIRLAELLKERSLSQNHSLKCSYPMVGSVDGRKEVKNASNINLGSLDVQKKNIFTVKMTEQLCSELEKFKADEENSSNKRVMPLKSFNVENTFRNSIPSLKLNFKFSRIKIPYFKSLNKDSPRKDELHEHNSQVIPVQLASKTSTNSSLTQTSSFDQSGSREHTINEDSGTLPLLSPSISESQNSDGLNQQAFSGPEEIRSERKICGFDAFQVSSAVESPSISSLPLSEKDPSEMAKTFSERKHTRSTSLSISQSFPKKSEQYSKIQVPANDSLGWKGTHKSKQQHFDTLEHHENQDLASTTDRTSLQTEPKNGADMAPSFTINTQPDEAVDQVSVSKSKSCMNKTVSNNTPGEDERRAYVRSLLQSPHFSFSPTKDSNKYIQTFDEQISMTEKSIEQTAKSKNPAEQESPSIENKTVTEPAAGTYFDSPLPEEDISSQPRLDEPEVEIGGKSHSSDQEHQRTDFNSYFTSNIQREGCSTTQDSGFSFGLFDHQDLNPLPSSGSMRDLFGSPKNEENSSAASTGGNFSLFDSNNAGSFFAHGSSKSSSSSFNFTYGFGGGENNASQQQSSTSSGSFFSMFSDSSDDDFISSSEQSSSNSSQPVFKLF